MVSIFRNISILFICGVVITLGQTNQKIEQKSGELEKIKVEIINLENDLKASEENEKKTIKVLEKINHQVHLVNKIIQNLDREEKSIELKINKLSKQIHSLETETKELKLDYAEYIKWLYVNGKEVKWNFLIKSDSFNQAVIRYKYFNYVTEKNEERLANLVIKRKEFEKLSLQLENKNIQKKKLEAEKVEEKNRLSKRELEKSNLIVQLNKNQNNIEKEIDKKRRYEIEIKSRIAKLIEIERERERKLREARFKNKSIEPIVPKVNYAKFENFSELRGKMNWPVASGKVIRKFGENKNKKLKTVTLNYGIDIKSKSNEKVFAVAEGVISVIDWIVGFGSIIIITHKGDYRTVYGHIDNIKVNEGDIVQAGTELGTVNQSLEGNIVHFEIWDERNYKDPQKWLVRK
ncbi:MAG: peptidoglycan DD-metalloendopeptidase family protein [Melioribacteraceae bacterium]|nr:peptidoglycan DD-metalloendopeptidase family protein [Melioribacteraceae bacterium]